MDDEFDIIGEVGKDFDRLDREFTQQKRKELFLEVAIALVSSEGPLFKAGQTKICEVARDYTDAILKASDLYAKGETK